MSCLSLDKGNPIAIIKGGQYKNNTIYLDKQSSTMDNFNAKEVATFVDEFYSSMDNKLDMDKMDDLQSAIENRKQPKNKDLRVFYNKCLKLMNKDKNKSIDIDEDEVVPVFDTTKERSVFMVSGMSGSGKSYYTANLCKMYHEQYPDNKIFLFSNKKADPAFDVLEYIYRISIDDSLLEDKLTLDEIKNSLVLYDDVEFTANKQIDAELTRLSDLILQQGRSMKISFVYITHQSNNYKATKNILNECHSVTIFPAMTTRYSLKYLLNNYFGFTKPVIEKICKLPSRWVNISKSPPLVLHSKGCYLVDC
jgi:hypothetical protein